MFDRRSKNFNTGIDNDIIRIIPFLHDNGTRFYGFRMYNGMLYDFELVSIEKDEEKYDLGYKIGHNKSTTNMVVLLSEDHFKILLPLSGSLVEQDKQFSKKIRNNLNAPVDRIVWLSRRQMLYGISQQYDYQKKCKMEPENTYNCKEDQQVLNGGIYTFNTELLSTLRENRDLL